MLRSNDRVCFEVDTPTLDDYASVPVEGRLVDVDDLDERARVKRMNGAKYNRLRKGYRTGHGRGGAEHRTDSRYFWRPSH